MELSYLQQPALQQCEPALGEQYKEALWMPAIAQMRNPRLIKSLRGSLDHRQISYEEHCEVKGLVIENRRIAGVVTPTGEYRADKVIIAGGAWSAEIIKQYAEPPAVEPVKGQMIIFKGEPDQLRRIILSQGRYVIPRRDGRILTGSTLEHTAFDKQTTKEALEDLRAAAISMVPLLEDLSIEHHWSGLRPGSPSGIPYICEHPDILGLYINSGHFRNGVVLGAASACLMAAIVQNKTFELDHRPYALQASH